jgi:glucosamine-6-phosphate deaminase
MHRPKASSAGIRNMDVILCDDATEVAAQTAQLIAGVVRQRAHSVLGLCAGSTPCLTYAKLARMHRDSGLSFSRCRSFSLDEYCGLEDDHPQSFRQFMNTQLFNKIDIPLWRTHMLNGMTKDADKECMAFETLLVSSGGVDCWLLGLGGNGHIAFNEPGSARESRTRPVDLTVATRNANGDGRFFGSPDEVPRKALSVGIATILEARRILLIATGTSKAAAVARAVEGPVSAACPASYLQTHGAVTAIIDRNAASGLDPAIYS